ncbi:PEP-CTERM sorting domain-containing protein [Candidatus Uabimicrobium sp. HlEnr_7]|uniref:PEP-CTERM sorting domain-containing protein n=1 Tax=Candidatus Uabimicrobium helgolandensis TaxID=3095367 RepID=UPI003555DE45
MTITIEINDGITFDGAGVFDIGVPISVEFDFSTFGTFSVDTLVDSSIGARFDMLFENNTDGFLYGGGSLDNNELGPGLLNESFSEYLVRTGNTFTNDFVGVGILQAGVLGNNGSDTITSIVLGLDPDVVTVTTAVPEPSTYAILLFTMLGFVYFKSKNVAFTL